MNGFASVNALGQDGTTGGEGGPTVVVDTTEELLEAIDTLGPLVILVSGTINITSKQGVRPDKGEVFDGGLRRYCCIGDGSQEESQDPMFRLEDGATLQNVIIGAPALTMPGGTVAGININFGDTARFSDVTVVADGDRDLVICQKYIGNDDGDEPTEAGSGADGTNCIYSSSDIIHR